MKYNKFLKFTGFVFGGALVGGVAGYALFYILVTKDMIGRGKKRWRKEAERLENQGRSSLRQRF